ncbi:TPA: hypothetical protein ACFB5P_001859 [Neisseria gonorrhoeae]
MNATLRFIDPKMKQAQPKLMTLGKSKLLELLVEDDDTLLELAEGGEVNGNTFDDVDRMTIKELRVALRESRETAEAKDKVIADKNKKVDELAEKLSKKQTGVKEPKPADVGIELTMQLGSLTAWKSVSARKSADCAICSSRWRRTARRMDLTTARRWSARSIKLFWTASNCAKAMPYRPKHRQTMCRNGWAVKREKAMNPAILSVLKQSKIRRKQWDAAHALHILSSRRRNWASALPRYTASWRRSASSRRANGAAMRARRSLNRKKPN